MIKKPVFFTNEMLDSSRRNNCTKTGYRTMLFSQEILHVPVLIHLKYSGTYINIEICEYL